MESTPQDDELLRFVERFALVLVQSGIPRMPARVFAYVLADDADRYTAGELAAGLRVSPAAISGAVRYLVQVGLVAKEREPGARVDTYRIYDDDVWSAILRQREPVIRRWQEILAEGADILGVDRRGGRRLQESLQFFTFVLEELPWQLERWQEYRRKLAEPPIR
ncbi:MAG: GbsR/MarR family transcriptional regulator [Jiangellaceae bacterium]